MDNYSRVGSIPTASTISVPVEQLADAGGLNPPSCGFESRPGHQSASVVRFHCIIGTGIAMKKKNTLAKRGLFSSKKTVVFSCGIPSSAMFDDAYASYMSHIIHYPRLTPKREAELSRIIRKSHDKGRVEAAVTEFVEGNLRLVVKCAIEYYKRYFNRKGGSLTLMDLITEGNFGLLKAVKLYNSDHKAHAKFGTYAIMSIRQTIRRAVQSAVLIHIPLNHYAYWPTINRLKEKYGDDIPEVVLADELGVPISAARLIKEAKCVQPARLDVNPAWEGIVRDKDRTDSKVNIRVLGDYLVEVMDKTLTPREKRIMFDLYLSGKDPTYEEVGLREGISRERIRQVSALAMRKMRRRIVGDWERVNRLDGIKVPICVEIFSSADKTSIRSLPSMRHDVCRGKDFDKRDSSLIASMID